MAFENVDPASLKNAINSCLQSLNTDSVTQLASNISNGNVWQSYASGHLKNAFQSLIESKYRELKSCLESCNQVADQIQKYKNLEEENKTLDSQYYELSKKLYYTYTYTEVVPTVINIEGNTGIKKNITKTYTATAKNYNVENQMNQIKNKINTNMEEMEILESKILGMN